MNIVFMSEIVGKKPVMSILMERQPAILKNFESFLQEMLNCLNESDIGNVLANENTSGDKSHAITMDNIMEIMLQDSVDDYFIIACWYFFGEYFLAMQLIGLCYASELTVPEKNLLKIMVAFCLAREYNKCCKSNDRQVDSLEKVMSHMYKIIDSYDTLNDFMFKSKDNALENDDLIQIFIFQKLVNCAIQGLLVRVMILYSADDIICSRPADSSICWRVWNTPMSLSEANDLIIGLWCWNQLFEIDISINEMGVKRIPYIARSVREKDWLMLLGEFEQLSLNELSVKYIRARELMVFRLFESLCLTYGEKEIKHWFGLNEGVSLVICSQQLAKMKTQDISRIIRMNIDLKKI